MIPVEPPKKKGVGGKASMLHICSIMITNSLYSPGLGKNTELGMYLARVKPLCDTGQYEEHPEVDPKHQDNLKDTFAQQRLAEVKSTVNDHCAKLDEQHDQEGLGNLVL